MYLALLVDDETSVTDALRSAISWADYGLQVAGVARSGEEALRYIEQMPIDVVITDIRMANLDGLSLCQRISRMERNIQTIIISGFAEFSYAQKALAYGALGYCLKPLEYDELRRYLLHAVSRLRQTEHLPDYDDLLDALQTTNEAEFVLALSSFGFSADAYYAAVSVGQERYPLAQKQGVVLRLGYNQHAYFSTQPFDMDGVQALMQSPGSLGFSYTHGALPVSALPRAVKELSNAAFQFFITPDRRVYADRVADEAAPVLREIGKAAALGDAAKTLALIDGVRDTAGAGFTLKSAWRLYNTVSACDAFSVDFAPEEISSPAQLAFRFLNFETLLTALHDGMSAEQPSQGQESLSNNSFIEMMRYINRHYDRGLSLGELAKEMNLNANYLSQVFKKETGQTFLKYVTELRIEKAKELLNSKDLSVSQIAASLGYNDYFYFLKTFKRVTGMTPKQYRQGYTASEPDAPAGGE